jgi:uncharacterized protein (TIGR03000 family)
LLAQSDEVNTMLKTISSFAKIAVLSTAVLLMMTGPSEAQRHGGGGRGGHGGVYHGGRSGVYHGGAYHGVAYHGGAYHSGYYHGGWGGYHNHGIRIGVYPYWGGYYPYSTAYYGGYYPYSSGYYGGYYTPYSAYYTAPYSVAPQVYQPYYPPDTVNPASTTSSTTATVQLILPSPTAEVWFGDYKSNQVGTTRQFATPPLAPGQTYTYEVRATWMVDGQPVTQTRTVRVEAGKTTTVDFSQPG